jgi:peptidoglycan/LPS O-acetylase OafA/YrhL
MNYSQPVKSEEIESTYWSRGFDVIWRFLPDVIAALCAVFLSPIPEFFQRLPTVVFRYGLVPILFSCFLFVSILQTGDSKRNLTRILLETKVAETMGYTSYSICKYNFYFQ